MRWFAVLVFLVAAGSSSLAASGLAVAPHIDPPGTPLFHEHLLSAYRYPLSLLRLPARAEHAGGPAWGLETPSRLQLDTLVLATLVIVVALLPGPARRALAVAADAMLREPQWRLGAPLGPPRAYLLATG